MIILNLLLFSGYLFQVSPAPSTPPTFKSINAYLPKNVESLLLKINDTIKELSQETNSSPNSIPNNITLNLNKLVSNTTIT